MKRLIIAAVALLSASALYSAELNGISAADIQTTRIELPAPVPQRLSAPKCGPITGEITELHLLARAGRNIIFTSAKTEAEFNQFVAMWTPILEKFGMKVTGTEYKSEFAKIEYQSADGRVVRMFLGNGMTYDGLSEEAMAKEQRLLLNSLEDSGMTPVAAFRIKNEFYRPTFCVYYLTTPEENMDHEAQLRQLKKGEDIDFDLLTGAVTLVKKDSTFSMVYIGKLLGFRSMAATDEAGAAVKLEKYKKYLAENKKEFIASRTYKLDEPFVVGEYTYNNFINMYFFQ